MSGYQVFDSSVLMFSTKLVSPGHQTESEKKKGKVDAMKEHVYWLILLQLGTECRKQ